MNKYFKNLYFLINFVSKTYLDLIFVCGIRWSVCVWVTQSCLFCDPIDYSPPGSSVYGILQARMLEWFAIPFFRGSSQPRDGTWVSHIADRVFIVWVTGEPFLRLTVIDVTDSFFKKTYPCTNCISVATLSWIRKTT